MSRHGLIARIAWVVAALGAGAIDAKEVQGPADAPRTSSSEAARAPASAPGASAGKPASAQASEPKLTVNRAVMAANGSMLQVRFTVPASSVTRWIPMQPKDTYVVDETSGEKFYVANLGRIGPAAQVRLPKEGGSSYMIIDNRHEHLKPGAKITVVVGALKQKHVTVAEQ
jgi:hypothetical protein